MKNFELMKDITKSASMQESTVVNTKPKVERAKKAVKQDKKVTLNLTDEEFYKLEQLCEAKRLSKSQFVKFALYDNGIL
ncbi:hypothetical protein [Aliarcobacter butzleri]|uniref:hypothetical protein n=1 Tax=Aliarcobacter butzleri TaxID=28197 RepID=UPI002B255082|nr:hypothetical protein [Aliarcobacter butzleri]